jgi:hypothetical protein
VRFSLLESDDNEAALRRQADFASDLAVMAQQRAKQLGVRARHASLTGLVHDMARAGETMVMLKRNLADLRIARKHAMLIAQDGLVNVGFAPELDVSTIRRRVGVYGMKPPAHSSFVINGATWEITWNQAAMPDDTPMTEKVQTFYSSDGKTGVVPTTVVPKNNSEDFSFNYYCRERVPIMRILAFAREHQWARDMIGEEDVIPEKDECIRRWDAGERVQGFQRLNRP